jgi:hypothetical protein
MCGAATCSPITAIGFGVLPPCCPMGGGEGPNACGAQAAAGVCLTTTPGTADPVCPMVTLMGFPLPGCCRTNGTCGVNLSILTLGCNDPSMVPGGSGGGAPCGGDSGPPPVDSGGTDTGPTDTGPGTDAPADTGPGTDAPPADTGPGTDAPPADTGPGTDTGPADTGRGDTGVDAPTG